MAEQDGERVETTYTPADFQRDAYEKIARERGLPVDGGGEPNIKAGEEIPRKERTVRDGVVLK